MVMNLWDPQNAGKFFSNCTTGSFSQEGLRSEINYVITTAVSKTSRILGLNVP
jgi:hypothetical protein